MTSNGNLYQFPMKQTTDGKTVDSLDVVRVRELRSFADHGMAVIAGEVRVAQGEGGEVVAIQDELVLKEGEHGGPARLERRERVLVAVPDEDGNVAVVEQVTVRAVEVGEVRT